MSNTGVGRGRGWLNLNKNQTTTGIPPRPGNVTGPIVTSLPSPKLTGTDDTQFADISNDFGDLINKIKQLNVNDDGIKFNQKIKYIIESWKEDCQTSDDVEHSFEVLHQECLADAKLASKLVIMIASRSFISQEVHDKNIRLMFLRKLQNNFEGSKQLQKTNPTAFRNSVQMLGEFYNKARLVNGQQLKFMATPFVSYLEMLLESAQPEDLKLFTIQLHLNGASVKTECPEKVTGMLNNIRDTLSSDKQLTKESKLWLLLALDIAGNKFGHLPAEVHKYYQDSLGDIAVACFQGMHDSLSVQTTHDSKTLDNYQSSVNVLQMSIPSETHNDQVPSPPYNAHSDLNNTSQSGSSGFLSDSSSQTSSVGHNKDKNNSSGKHGRPILGVGARFNKSKSNDDSCPNWRERDNSSGWNSKQKNAGDRADAKKTTKTGKGWEHDDRFDTDYS